VGGRRAIPLTERRKTEKKKKKAAPEERSDWGKLEPLYSKLAAITIRGTVRLGLEKLKGGREG